MKLTFLGTNGWYDTETGNTVSCLLESAQYNIVFDAGNGLHRLDKYIKNEKQIYIFISHFHLDHIIGLHLLAKFNFKSIKLFGQKGTIKYLNSIIKQPFTKSFDDLTYKVAINEMKQGEHKIPFPVTSKELFHSSPSFGYRLELDGKVISYCTDTGECKNLLSLAKSSDVLITECSYRYKAESLEWPHLDPETAAYIAKEVEAKRLFLTHFDPTHYSSLEERGEAEKSARKIFKNTIVAKDLMQFEI